MRFALAALVSGFFVACSSAEAVAAPPSPQRPKVGCIVATLRQNGTHEGKILPEVVLVIGSTPIDDGARWIVLRAPDFNAKQWEPHSKEEILFGARCKAGAELQQMFDATRGDGAAAARTRPPNQ